MAALRNDYLYKLLFIFMMDYINYTNNYIILNLLSILHITINFDINHAKDVQNFIYIFA